MFSVSQLRKNKRLFLWGTICIALVIAVGTLVPTGNFHSVPGNDKTHHLLGFAALTFPAAVYRPRMLLWCLPLAIAYGGVIEIIQPYVGRSRDIADFVADACGALLGAGLGVMINRLLPGDTVSAARRQSGHQRPKA